MAGTREIERALDSAEALLERGQVELARVRIRSLRESLRPQPRPSQLPELPLFQYTAPDVGPVIPDPYAFPDAICSCPMNPRTEHARGGVLLGTCVERQLAKPPGKNKKRDGTRTERKGGVHAYCASGKCTQGRANRRRCPEGFTPPKYRQNRPDAEKRAARAAMRLERLTTLPPHRERDETRAPELRQAVRPDPTAGEIVDECDSQGGEG